MSTTDLPGSSLLANRYRLVERLGAGGMSVVWRGFDEVLGRQVAVKVLPPSTSADPSFRRRLRAEAQAAARLSHPHITGVYDYGEATTVDGEAVPYVVMELVDGESLAAVLARTRRLPWSAAVRISAEVSAALAAAHARGIVHRDVTPANVMLTPSGAKVVDFGISALIGENDIDPDGSLLGTPAYLAPERLEGGQVSPATDVYAVGLLIYRTLIGQLPWDVGTTTALLRAHQYTEPEPLPPVEGLPVVVERLIARCLQKRPADRPSSAELAEVLAGVTSGAPSAGFVPDWADNGEDTTILPSSYPRTDERISRHGQARVPEQSPAGHGRAAVPDAERPSPMAPSAPGASLAAASAGLATGAPRPDHLAGPAAAGPPTGAPPVDGGGRSPYAGTPRNSRFAAPRAAASAPPDAPIRRPLPVESAPDTATPDAEPTGFASPGFASPGFASPAADAPPPDAPAASLRPAVGDAPAVPAAPSGAGAAPPHRPSAPPPAGGARAAQGGNRRLFVLCGTMLAIAAAAGAWSLMRHDGTAPNTVAVKEPPPPSVVPDSGKCVVSYAVMSDARGRFNASVTVANRNTTAIKDWRLWFLMQGDQVMKSTSGAKLTQDGKEVRLTSGGTLQPQKALTFRVSGRYERNNAAPMAFELNGNTCRTYVSTKPGEPSRSVERLSNGTTKLGPVAAADPATGIVIGPSGVVSVGPTTPGASRGASEPIDPAPVGSEVVDEPLSGHGTETSIAPNPDTDPPSATPSPTATTVAATTSPVVAPPGDTSTPDPVDSGPDKNGADPLDN
ncbi:serine/threonine-protein kinase [Mangrovihabitans endophyticus]|nr:serine/threonine-protein kinase [Mangrovihabitans endophyticus]